MAPFLSATTGIPSVPARAAISSSRDIIRPMRPRDASCQPSHGAPPMPASERPWATMGSAR